MAKSKISKVFGEWKSGKLRSGSKSGPVVTSHAQATAIALSEARKAGADIPKKKKKRKAQQLATHYLTEEHKGGLRVVSAHATEAEHKAADQARGGSGGLLHSQHIRGEQPKAGDTLEGNFTQGYSVKKKKKKKGLFMSTTPTTASPIVDMLAVASQRAQAVSPECMANGTADKAKLELATSIPPTTDEGASKAGVRVNSTVPVREPDMLAVAMERGKALSRGENISDVTQDKANDLIDAQTPMKPAAIAKTGRERKLKKGKKASDEIELK